MSISSINYSSSVLGSQIRNINQQLTDLSTQLSTGKLSQNYSGMGTNEGFAIAGRAQLSNIAAYTDTITNVNVSINLANTALQSLTKIRNTVQTGSANTAQDLNVNGQTVAQNTAAAQFGSMVGVLNTQTGNRYLFSGTAVNTQSVADAGDIINGTTTQAGFKAVMAERQAADLGANGMGRLVQTQPTPSSVQVSEDVAGSPFGLKIKAVSSTLTGATVTGPSGSPVSFSVDLNGTNPSNGDKLSVQFTLPDGTTEQIDLTASTATPTPLGSFAIDASVPVNPNNTAANLNTALNTAIKKLANTSLVAASAVTAGDNFFNTASSAIGTPKSNQAAPPAPISGATALSGTSPSDSISPGFVAGDTITVNGTTLTFVSSGATGNQLNVGDSIQTLMSKIDQITGTSKPSTIHGGSITINTDDAASLNITSSNTGALGSIGFSATPVTATQPPLRVGSSPASSATTLVNGSATTVKWYLGNDGPGSPRSTAMARVDDSVTVQYGAQADEDAIRRQLQAIAVFGTFSTSPTGQYSGGQVSALSLRVTQALTQQPGQQRIEDIQTDIAMAQNTMKDASTRQTQAKAQLQTIIDQAESAPPDQVASEILALQNALQASYQVTSKLAQLSLVKFL
ncbi:flagellin-like hook-associated protein FlgL [Bradyrhizobium japonicum]|uniref:Flagellar protein n=1 Tax=Bradyrhizobium diazoefficiens TaxID=1355477 RepID=A0A810C625_9BRAD|nr:flagellar protein [Bradyrhizobium diazoefficiens]MBP1063902.1 flagellin-like hook-associated protein FlgL [Bradyrhizobium japonicum]BCA05700.1 flagellar protein [Bradyrhizobium diazoefficiens]BCA23054.1 flagellar protein [Bradyrhizobium diazoefficiens]BCE32427.1 flagellar protein [Bradyrhizobium diazoefficiens]BCE41212.1 flagellar protein [Bradyrhizobium diazoefficiens]